MVRGLHDSCCANQTLLRPCRFSSALIASPMCGSSFIPSPFAEPRPQKATMKKAWKLFALPSTVDFWTTMIERQVQKAHANQRELLRLVLLYQ